MRVVLLSLLLHSACGWNLMHALKKHKIHRKRVITSEKVEVANAEALSKPAGAVVVDPEYTAISGKSYYEASEICKKGGKRICDAEEVCNLRTDIPIRGQLKGDRWAPVGDRYNDWIQVGAWAGSKTGKSCMTHTGCCHSVPAWGNDGQTKKMDQVSMSNAVNTN
jgi:hypothetical protein